MDRKAATAAAEVGLTVSVTVISPRASPSQPTSTGVRPSACSAAYAARSFVRHLSPSAASSSSRADHDRPGLDLGEQAEAGPVAQRGDLRAAGRAPARTP